MGHSMHVAVRGQLGGVSFLLGPWITGEVRNVKCTGTSSPWRRKKNTCCVQQPFSVRDTVATSEALKELESEKRERNC